MHYLIILRVKIKFICLQVKNQENNLIEIHDELNMDDVINNIITSRGHSKFLRLTGKLTETS